MNDSNQTNILDFKEYKNPAYERSYVEQRQALRYPLNENIAIPVSFYNNGGLYRGIINNLSVGGACIELAAEPSEESPELSIGRTMECYLLYRYGRSKCRGMIRWVKRNTDRFTWGITFVELSYHIKDPFRILINDVCYGGVFMPVTGMAVY